MIRNLKVLGLAAMAVLALSAMAASVAFAQNGRITSTGDFTLTGTEIAGKPNALTFAGLSTECPGSTYTGHKYNVTPHTFIPSGSEPVTITPIYKQPCKTSVGPTTIDMNGCDYVIHIGATNGVDTFAVTYDIVCLPGKDITFTSWFSTAEHTGMKESCTKHIPPQTGLPGGTITDTTAGDLILGGPVKGIKVIQTKDALHPLLCPAKEGEGELDINVTLQGDNAALTNTSVSLSHL